MYYGIHQNIVQQIFYLLGTRTKYLVGCKVVLWFYGYHAKDLQKIKKKKKTKTPRITDEGWNSQKRLSDPVEKKMKEGKRRKKRLLYLHPKLSSGLVPL